VNRPLQDLLNQVQRYPRLNHHVSQTWIQSAASDPWRSAWHPFFSSDPSVLFKELETAIVTLERASTQGVTARVPKLMAATWEHYQAARDEVVQAARLVQRGYVVRFVPESSHRTPDLEVVLRSGEVVCVELTSVNRTWQHDVIVPYLRDQLASLNRAHVLTVRLSADILPFDEADMSGLVVDIRNHMLAGPHPMGSSSLFRIDKRDDHIEVEVLASDHPDYSFVSGVGDDFSEPLQSVVSRLVRKAAEKADQFANYSHGVLLMTLGHETMSALPMSLPVGDAIWDAVRQEFARSNLPGCIDAISLNWGIGTGRVLELTAWSRTPEAEQLSSLLAHG